MDANDCREYAKKYIEIANHTPNTKGQSVLFDLTAAWNRLAAELDNNEVLRDKMQGLNLCPT